jgi:hypothetical protein
MRFRKLRIAWSVAWGIAAVLLVALWVRSYWWDEQLNIPLSDTRVFAPQSFVGTVSFGFCTSPEAKFMWPRGLRSNPVSNDIRLQSFAFGRFTGIPVRTVAFVRVPHWFLLILAAALTAVPWLRWRLSLPTLLIATTLVALALGLIVWLR